MTDKKLKTKQPVECGEECSEAILCTRPQPPKLLYKPKVETQTSILDLEDDKPDDKDVTVDYVDDEEQVKPCGICWWCWETIKLIYPYLILGGVYAGFLIIWNSVLLKSKDGV